MLGVVVFFVPTLGVPDDWKQYILMTAGVLLLILGFLLRRSAYYRNLDKGNGELSNDSFVESAPPESAEPLDLHQDKEISVDEASDYKI